MSKVTDTFTVEPGVYWLGDPNYVFPKRAKGDPVSLWHVWLENSYANRPEVDPNYLDVLDAEIGGHRVVAFSTLYGDGEYGWNRNHWQTFPVDTGLIGLVPIEFAVLDDWARRDGVIAYFDESTTCLRYEDGTLVFGSIEIYTGWEGE